MNILFGKDDVAHTVAKPYFGVDNVARQVNKGYIGVNGIARQFFGSNDGGHFEIESFGANIPSLMSIAFGNGKYAGGYNLSNQYDGLYLGDDLTTLKKDATYSKYEKVLFGNGVFIATNLLPSQSKNDYRVVVSDGTVGWSPAETEELNQYEWKEAEFGNDVFVLIGIKKSGSNKILASATSTDGKTWLFHEIGNFSYIGSVKFLRFYHGIFLFFASLRNNGEITSTKYLVTSTDGKSWNMEQGPLEESGKTTHLSIDYLAYAGSSLAVTQADRSIFTFQALDQSKPGLFTNKQFFRTAEILPDAYWREIGRDDLIYITFSGYQNNEENCYFAYSKDGLKWRFVKIPNVQKVSAYLGYANERHILQVVNDHGNLQFLTIKYMEG